ncbi:IS1595 family transposase [Candidatus Nitronereus thalassa]|uniref:IS1595 family transposase n=1 Tax=Candidatus Nitronereus thalassa TaxID=3020898 RepID=A0ABU3K534_9BACT|nr:IS1595 family transposase [Candidatus Nitronereus thalassa]MDT7041507.1 IS1595 family transposase [Candidatus Nitronereus thalassa]
MKTYTLKQFQKDFPNDEACLEWLMQSRWPNGIHCKKCNRVTKHHRLTNRPKYSCQFCGNHVSPLAGTILEKSSTSLYNWFYAMYLMASTRCGVSAKQIERETGVTYKTAWRMYKQIRSMLGEDYNLEGSSVEVDETYIGGKRKGKRGRGAEGKSIVVGAVQRKGKVVAKKVENVKANTLVPFVTERVLPKTIVYTDELPSYNKLPKMGYDHRRIHHASKVYVMGDIHTNNIEGFWSLVKRGINGVYHAVSDKYLQNYLDEYAFRYNRRDNPAGMFNAFVSRVVTSARAE